MFVSMVRITFKYMVFQQRCAPTMSYIIIPYLGGGQKGWKLS